MHSDGTVTDFQESIGFDLSTSFYHKFSCLFRIPNRNGQNIDWTSDSGTFHKLLDGTTYPGLTIVTVPWLFVTLLSRDCTIGCAVQNFISESCEIRETSMGAKSKQRPLELAMAVGPSGRRVEILTTSTLRIRAFLCRSDQSMWRLGQWQKTQAGLAFPN
jgi:hypothetical protein